MLPGPHDAGVVVDDDEVSVVGEPAQGEHARHHAEHLHYLTQQRGKCGDVTGWQFIATHFHGIKYEIEYKLEEDTRTGSTIPVE